MKMRLEEEIETEEAKDVVTIPWEAQNPQKWHRLA